MLVSEFAVKAGERVFSGATLRAALKKLITLPGVSNDEKINMLLSAEYGYVTDEGEFMSTEPRSTGDAEEPEE